MHVENILKIYKNNGYNNKFKKKMKKNKENQKKRKLMLNKHQN